MPGTQATPTSRGGKGRYVFALLLLLAFGFFFRNDLPLSVRGLISSMFLADAREKGIVNEQTDNELRPLEIAVRNDPSDSNIKALKDKKVELKNRAAAILKIAPPPPPPVVVTNPSPAPTPQLPAKQMFAGEQFFLPIHSDHTADEYEFQLDARDLWKSLPGITVSDGDEVQFSASGQVCGGVNIGCSGPNGQDNLAKTSLINPSEFPVGDALCQSLVARIGPSMFQVGDHRTYPVPDGTGSQSIELMDNYRIPYLATTARGGFLVKLKIVRKH